MVSSQKFRHIMNLLPTLGCGYIMTVVFQSRKLPSFISLSYSYLGAPFVKLIFQAFDENYWQNKVYRQMSVRRLEARTEAESKLRLKPTWSSILFDFETHCGVWLNYTLRHNNFRWTLKHIGGLRITFFLVFSNPFLRARTWTSSASSCEL